jgi:hypothetical protein
MKYMHACIIAMGLVLAGCDAPSEPPAPKADEPQSTVFDGQIKAMQKARQAEGDMQKAEEARRQQTEQATQ